jgi:hypothetical protein
MIGAVQELANVARRLALDSWDTRDRFVAVLRA